MEQYARRPDSTELVDFDNMLYPDFHRQYEQKTWKNMSNSEHECAERATELPHESALEFIDDPTTGEPHDNSKWTVRRTHEMPVWWDWLLPSTHGDHYFYQKLLLVEPWRDPTPERWITYASNPTGCMRQECVLRGKLGDGDDLQNVLRADAEARLFSPEAVERYLQQEHDHESMSRFIDAMSADAAPDAMDVEATPPVRDATSDEGDDDEQDAMRLRDEMAAARRVQPRRPAPDVRLSTTDVYAATATPRATWHRARKEPLPLTRGQYEAYELLKHAGERQLLTFLSGEGGVGKSTLIKLLIAYWRSEGLRVIVLASSAKAARLIGGHTVHSACLLDCNGSFAQHRLEGQQGSDRFMWLARADVVVIDEISMLTSSALSGVSAALNYVTRMAAPIPNRNLCFGHKSVVALGDLFQLPAVEKGPRELQVYQGLLWSRFKFLELDELVRQDASSAYAALLSRARTAWCGQYADGTSHADYREADEQMLRTRLCIAGSAYGHTHSCIYFQDRQHIRSSGKRRRQDEVVVSQDTWHCPIAPNAYVLASKCAKVAELNGALRPSRATSQVAHVPSAAPSADDVHHVLANARAAVAHAQGVAATMSAAAGRSMNAVPTQSVQSATAHATDTYNSTKALVHCVRTRTTVDSALSGLLRTVDYYVGQRVLITVNKQSVSRDYANAVEAIVVALHNGHRGDLGAIFVRPVEWPTDCDRAPLKIMRHSATARVQGQTITRYMFPLIPSAAMTVHSPANAPPANA